MYHRVITAVSVGLLSTIFFSSSAATAFIPSSTTSVLRTFTPKENTQFITIQKALRDRNDQSTPTNFARTRHNHLYHAQRRVDPSRRNNNSPTRIGSMMTKNNRSLPKYSVPNNDDNSQPDHEDTTTASSSSTSSTSTPPPSFDDKVSPPPNYDPRQFDSFDGGDWSTNVNNPFVAAKYVRFTRRAASVSTDDDVTQHLHDSVEEEARKKRKDAWVQARELEQKAEELKKEMMMGMGGGTGSTSTGGAAMEEAARKRREAWSKAKEEDDGNF